MQSRQSPTGRRLLVLGAIAVATLVAIILVFRYSYRDEFFVDIQSVLSATRSDLCPDWNPLHWTGLAYLLIATIIAFLQGWRIGRSTLMRRWKVRLTVFTSTLALVSSLLYSLTGFWNADTDESNGMAAATVFVVENGEVPALLKPVIDGAKKTKPGSRCLYTTAHNTASCIQPTQGTVPAADWVTPDNADQADIELRYRVSSGAPMPETLTYSHKLKVWSMLRNGLGNKGMTGIATWEGPGHKPSLCKFEEDHQLNYSFGGHWGTNLDNQIAEAFPALQYNTGDASGYCVHIPRVNNGLDDVPFIVLPVTKTVPHGRVASPRAAGVLIITGSSSGEPDIRHMSTVKADDLPVPAYPRSLALKQRESINWAAGRGNMNDGFGFKVPRDDPMRYVHSTSSGHDLWVTPLQQRRGGAGGRVVAYAVIVADESAVGMLAEQRVYVLPDPDTAGRMNGLPLRERDRLMSGA